MNKDDRAVLVIILDALDTLLAHLPATSELNLIRKDVTTAAYYLRNRK